MKGKIPTVEDIVSKIFFATTEDLLLIPNKNLLQLNSDRLPCGAFLFWEKKDPTTGHKRVFLNVFIYGNVNILFGRVYDVKNSL